MNQQMKRTIATAASLVLSTALCAADSREDDWKKASIDELRVPSSPAFEMLGVAPTAVERPSTARALGLSLLSATERSGSGIPTDIAMEFAPYWWKGHPNLTFDHYYSKDKGIWETVKETFAVSLGTTDLQDRVGVPGTRTGLGLRLMLRQGYANKDLESRVKALKDAQLLLLQCVPFEPTEPIDEDCINAHEGDVRKAREGVLEKAERVGWTIEVASGVTRDFAQNDANLSGNTRVGGWVTGSYHTGGSLSVVTVGRYLTSDDPTGNGHTEDIGARLIMKGDSTGGLPPIAISIEALRRFTQHGDDSSRIVALLEYRLPLENLSLVASYGQDFRDVTGQESMVSTLGIQLGVGKGPFVTSQ